MQESADRRVTAPADVEARAKAEAALARFSPRLRHPLSWGLSRWPGRVVIRSSVTAARVALFDRAMTIAAQFFSSVFPILILWAAWADGGAVGRIADAVDLPDASQSVVQQAVTGADDAGFGVFGVLIVLLSATSLSRALTRAFALIWDQPRPKTRIASLWRWLAAVLVLVLSLVAVRLLGGRAGTLPPPGVWDDALVAVGNFTVALLTPWVLLEGRLRARLLMPGAAIYAGAMLAVRPIGDVWFPQSLQASASHYGSIGVAFAYLAWLYVISFTFLAAAILGQVITTDRGWLGRAIQGNPSSPDTSDDEISPCDENGRGPGAGFSDGSGSA